jgi:predicted helicase
VGLLLEKMVVSHLKNEPKYKNKYSDVWMLNDVPAESHVSKTKKTEVLILSLAVKRQEN